MSVAQARQSCRLPAWFKQEIPSAEAQENSRFIADLKVNTVCQEAHCPNLSRCFAERELTFMILGPSCTRGCCFCAVDKASEADLSVDAEEPERIAEAIARLRLDYVVVTSVTRDDLSDGGAGHFARTIKLIRARNGNVPVETLIPDFQGSVSDIKTVIIALPQVLAHNLETVRRLSSELRPQADYDRSLAVLMAAKQNSGTLITKSSLMLGLGETRKEVMETMQELRKVNCDILVLGQYLAPSAGHYPVKEFIEREEFIKYRESALSLGFKAVSSAPLARSSYQAKELYRRALNA
jgi:lipoyl synthase